MLHNAISQLSSTNTSQSVPDAIYAGLGGILVDDNDQPASLTDVRNHYVPQGDGFSFSMRIHFGQTTTAHFDTGLPGLPLQVAPTDIHVSTTFDHMLAFQFSGGSTTVDSQPLTGGLGRGHEWVAAIGVSSIDNFSAVATLGFVKGTLTPAEGMPNTLTATLVADHLDSAPQIDLGFNAALNLQLTGGLSGVAEGDDFPSIGAQIHLNWTFDAAAPTAHATLSR